MSYRPLQQYEPITWKGTITPVSPRSPRRSRQEEAGPTLTSVPPAPPAPKPLRLGSLEVPTPVVLAPMAGITNAAYRRLCSEQGAGLYVCEMITSRGLVEGDATTRQMLVFDELETVRSVQLYGTDPAYVGKATEILCAEYGVAHVDLNFGCPVPKVTRKGGGAALPWKRTLLGEILEAAVAAGARYGVPVTMKTRKGIDDDHLTYLDAGRIAQESGVAAIALHGRTAIQGYSGAADWDAIAPTGRARRHPGARQRRHLGGRRRAPDGRADRRRRCRRRARVPRPTVAVPRPGRGVRRRARRDAAQAGRGGRDDASARRAAGRAHGGGAGLQGVPQARLVVPQGVPCRRRPAAQSRSGEHARRSSTGCSWSSTRTAEFPVAELGTPRGRQGSPRKGVALPEGWLDDTDGTGSVVREEASETTGG